MSNLREGTKVRTTTGLIGTVEALYDLGTVVYYIVKLEDGSLYKFFEEQLAEIEEELETAPEEEPTESDTITITREEFRKKVIEATTEVMKQSIESCKIGEAFLITTSGAVICAKTEIALFGEPKENV